MYKQLLLSISEKCVSPFVINEALNKKCKSYKYFNVIKVIHFSECFLRLDTIVCNISNDLEIIIREVLSKKIF